MYNEIVDALYPILLALGGVLAGFLIRLIQMGAAYLMKKADSYLLDTYVMFIEGVAIAVVRSLNQRMVNDLKAAGEFTPEKQKEAFENAKAEITAILSDSAKTLVSKAVGDLDTYIKVLIEEAVLKLKKG